jgi:hypothetical protein
VVSLGATPIQEVPRGSVKPELRTRNGGVMSLHPDSSEITSMPNLEEVGHVERGGVDQSQTQVETGQPLTEVNMEQGDDEEDTADQVASGLGKLMMDPGGTASKLCRPSGKRRSRKKGLFEWRILKCSLM